MPWLNATPSRMMTDAYIARRIMVAMEGEHCVLPLRVKEEIGIDGGRKRDEDEDRQRRATAKTACSQRG